MKTYPHQEDGEIINLVRKDDHDAVVRELNQRLTQQQSDMLDTIVKLRTQLSVIKTAAANAGFSEWIYKTLAAYNSAKSGNLPDPLAEAVKRMEEVTDGAIEAAYWESGSWTRNIRALLISAAKGEQP